MAAVAHTGSTCYARPTGDSDAYYRCSARLACEENAEGGDPSAGHSSHGHRPRRRCAAREDVRIECPDDAATNRCGCANAYRRRHTVVSDRDAAEPDVHQADLD